MPTLTVDRFEIGLDRRKGQIVSDANRLWEASNVFIDTGRHISKRPGLNFYGAFTVGKGLIAAGGFLNSFVRGSAGPTVVTGVLREVQCNYTTGAAVSRVWFGQSYAGAIFVLLEAGSNLISCFDTSAPPDAILEEVTDANCPTVGTEQTYPCAIILASKVFMGDDTQVSYSATDDPTDWTLAGDAGAINAARNALGSSDVKALGQYQGDLIIFFEDSAQAWKVDPDPSLFSLRQSIDSVGCRYPRSVSNLASDVFFLAKGGFRSISLLSLTSNLADVDVGTAIDTLVRASLATLSGNPIAQYNAGGGQYICAIDDDIYVYSFSRTAKISAWTQYALGFAPDDFASLDGIFYIRTGNDVYFLDDALYQDETGVAHAAQSFTAQFRTSMFDMKRPGIMKLVSGCDVVQTGQCDIRFHYQYVDGTGETQTGTTDWVLGLKSNTRPGGIIPVDLCVTEIAVEARNTQNAAWTFEAISLHYEELGLL